MPQQQQQQPPHAKSIAADANFLEDVDVTQVASVVDLHRANLLRVQAQELVNECSISTDKTWVKVVAQEYMEHVARVVSQMDLSGGGRRNDDDGLQQLPAAPFSTRLSDRKSAGATLSQNDNNPIRLQVAPLEHPFLGLSTAIGNANVLPTFVLHVKIPAVAFGPKEYLRNRYFDKRNRIVWAVAVKLQQQCNSESSSSSIGSVYWQYSRGDVRKPNLLLIPPTQQQEAQQQQQPNNTKNTSKKKKRHKKSQAAESSAVDLTTTTAIPRTKSLKFRVQLVFGFGADAMEWIPPLRLLPNRCNLANIATSDKSNVSSSSSQMYNHAIMEDAFVGVFGSSSSDHDMDVDDDMFDDMEPVLQATCLLAKTWCLQRGLLRAHDGLDAEQLLALLVYLFRTRQANARMAPTQVLATLWKLLVTTDWIGEHTLTASSTEQQSLMIRVAPSEAYKGDGLVGSSKRAALVMPRPGKTENQTIATCKFAQMYAQQTKESPLTDHDPSTLLELWQTEYTIGPVLLDPSMRYNYLGRCSPSYMRDLVHCSQMALDRLHERLAFETLFMRRSRFWMRYDVYMQVPLNKIAFDVSELWGHDRADLGDYESISRGIIHVLRRALGDRVHAIRLLSTGNGKVNGHVDAISDSDEAPAYSVNDDVGKKISTKKVFSPTGTSHLVIGVTINSDTCYRIVDRGPPADDVQATATFLKLWGKTRAQLRRFKDGAIVHAVVWDSTVEEEENVSESSYIRFHNDDKQQGGIIERIMRHILKLHFLSDGQQDTGLQFSLRNVMSAVDGVQQQKPSNDLIHVNQLSSHRMILKAFDSLAEFLRTNSAPTLRVEGSSELISRIGIPLAVDAVEPVSPALRYAELFPPTQHPDLGAISPIKVERISGAVLSAPIEIQIRFGASSKWPTDIKAIGAAKAAMLVSLVDGIEKLKRSGLCKGFDGTAQVTSMYADIGYMGYVFRIRVRADPELRLLRSLSKPSSEAVALLQLLTKRHVLAATHHSMVHAVYISHPSSSAVTRLAKRWVASHMLSGHIPFEAIELLVVHVYTNKTSPGRAPGSVTAGFMRFLDVLSGFDWAKEPLIVDPQGHFDDEALTEILHQFEGVRGPDWKHGPPMFIISSSHFSSDDSGDSANFGSVYTETNPETVVLLRASALARRTYDFLHGALIKFESDTWPAAFHETASSFRSYSALLRVDSNFCIDAASSSTGGELDVLSDKDGALVSGFTRSMILRIKGPKSLQRKAYRNLELHGSNSLLLEFNPVDQVVNALRTHLGVHLLVFYNDLCPEVVSILWRRPRLAAHAFAAVASEYVRPVLHASWKNDTLVTVNVKDLLRCMSHHTHDIVVDYKVFDHGLAVLMASPAVDGKPRSKRKAVVEGGSGASESDSE